MATYTVWVQLPDMGGRVTLTHTYDQEAATELVSALVGAASGVTLDIGVTIEDEAAGAARQTPAQSDADKAGATPTPQPPHGAAPTKHGAVGRPK